jgi:hypothetical protein
MSCRARSEEAAGHPVFATTAGESTATRITVRIIDRGIVTNGDARSTISLFASLKIKCGKEINNFFFFFSPFLFAFENSFG